LYRVASCEDIILSKPEVEPTVLNSDNPFIGIEFDAEYSSYRFTIDAIAEENEHTAYAIMWLHWFDANNETISSQHIAFPLPRWRDVQTFDLNQISPPESAAFAHVTITPFNTPEIIVHDFTLYGIPPTFLDNELEQFRRRQTFR
jgi:hypothetical protein